MLDDRLARAAERGDTAAVMDLIDECRLHAPDSVYEELQLGLLWAAIGGHSATIAELVKRGPDVKSPEAQRGNGL